MEAKEDLLTSRSCTEYKLSKVRHIWTIRNFVFCQAKTGTSLQSSIFRADGGSEWCIVLYPNGFSVEHNEFSSLFLKLSSPDETNAFEEVEYRFTLLNEKGVVIFPRYNATFIYKKFVKNNISGYNQFIKKIELDKLLKREALNICCEITVCRGRIDSASLSNDSSGQHSSKIPNCTLADDLTSLFKDQTFGDTTIQVENTEFFVYRGFLQARSPVFAAMFKHAMKEQMKNRVIITDIEPKVMEETLTYIYTGRSPNMISMANDLLPVADKYNLERLKVLSEEALSKKITKDNVIETLILADLHRASQLKIAAINFITTNRHYYIDAVNWKKITLALSMQPELIVEITSALFSSRG